MAKKRTTRRQSSGRRIADVPGRRVTRRREEEARKTSEESGVFVNRVTLDNTVPGGFRYERVAVPQPGRS